LEERLMRAHKRQGSSNDINGSSGDTFWSKAAVFFCCNRCQQSDDPQHHDQGGNTIDSSAQTQSLGNNIILFII